MSPAPRGIRLPEQLQRDIELEAESNRMNWSQTVIELLEEAIRIRKVPGVIFADGPAGRRAVLAGTGLDVWEIVATWFAVEKDYERLKKSYDWLPETSLRSALGYYRLYPDEIDARLEREERWTPQRVAEEMPFSAPGSAGSS